MLREVFFIKKNCSTYDFIGFSEFVVHHGIWVIERLTVVLRDGNHGATSGECLTVDEDPSDVLVSDDEIVELKIQIV